MYWLIPDLAIFYDTVNCAFRISCCKWTLTND